MIRFSSVTITYPGATAPALRDVDLEIPEGELCLVVGPTGAGKSTLLGAINGQVPHFTGGLLSGRVEVAGHDTAAVKPRDLADVVGVVPQDPAAGFVTDTVEQELAFTMEQLGLAPEVMRKRVEEVLDLLGVADLRDRALRTLSGGQQQRVAIGAVLTAHPRVLVLDEPTSALDPTAAEEVLAAITRLVHDLGVTAVVAEHRLERIIQYADTVVEVHADRTVTADAPAAAMATAAVAPPVVQLGRLAGWSPLPLSVRDARRAAGPLRDRLQALPTPSAPPLPAVGPLLTARGLHVRYGATPAVRDVDLDLHAGQVVALMGRNGSGKSSLLWALQGSGRRDGGQVVVAGQDPAGLDPRGARRLVGLVPQTPSDLLYLSTVDAECAQADDESDAPSGSCRALLDGLVGAIAGDTHPRDLSEGQRLALALAVQLTAEPRVVLLDEPTRGLDQRAKQRLTAVLRRLAADRAAVVVSTHDVEFVASACDRVVVLAQGDLVADGPTADVVVASPAFAPQVAKVLAPGGWLTVDEVRNALAGAVAEP
ncbi:ATP-binding cassette domain-containing protein [Euzebya sp.]|uniref:ABC transporter ATP-binding protein n=1 Tax=Euzebya sp. TaxID=1971409 RepID=UPI003512713E